MDEMDNFSTQDIARITPTELIKDIMNANRQAYLRSKMNVTTEYEHITEELTEDLLTPLDRGVIQPQNDYQQQWMDSGVVYLPKFIPDNLLGAYDKVRVGIKDPAQLLSGWRETPYLHVKEIRDISLYAPLMAIMKDLISEPVGLHLNLTGYVTTQRDWHSDNYLNPENVGSYYIATWVAIDDIHPDSGPFEFVPGSHKWPCMTRRKIFSFLTPEEKADPAWPSKTERWVGDACMKEIVKRGTDVVTYLPKKGDVLIWHAKLVHRGSVAKVPMMLRKSLISHYSALSRRPDMPERRQHDNGETFFWFPHELR